MRESVTRSSGGRWIVELAHPGAEVYVDKVAFNMDDVLNFTSIVTTPYGGGASTESYTSNGMNEYTAVGGVTHTYDDNGNLKTDGTDTRLDRAARISLRAEMEFAS